MTLELSDDDVRRISSAKRGWAGQTMTFTVRDLEAMLRDRATLIARVRELDVLNEHAAQALMLGEDEALKELVRLRNLLNHILDADKSQLSEVEEGKDCYLSWWAYDVAIVAARGESIAGTFAEKPPEPRGDSRRKP